jgi:hypothetical protein
MVKFRVSTNARARLVLDLGLRLGLELGLLLGLG